MRYCTSKGGAALFSDFYATIGVEGLLTKDEGDIEGQRVRNVRMYFSKVCNTASRLQDKWTGVNFETGLLPIDYSQLPPVMTRQRMGET